MGAAEQCSMLYLESRCVSLARAMGVQGVQNGGIDGVGVAASVPRGHARADGRERHGDGAQPRVLHRQRRPDVGVRRPPHRPHAADPARRQRLRLLRASARSSATTTCSGRRNGTPRTSTTGWSCSATGASTAGCARVSAEHLGRLRRRGCRGRARPCTATSASPTSTTTGSTPWWWPTDRGTWSPGTRWSSRRRPPRSKPQLTGFDVDRRAERTATTRRPRPIMRLTRERLRGDHLQTSAIFDERFRVLSMVTDPNDYAGPGTGLRADRRAPRRDRRDPAGPDHR